MTDMPHLWEVDHPYYCEEGNYGAGQHESFDSWAEFIGEWGHTDPDLNLVFRWDWKRDDGKHLEEGEATEPDKLCVYWVLQRKAGMRSTECIVTEADEPAVREWLTERAKTIAAVWEPIALGGAA